MKDCVNMMRGVTFILCLVLLLSALVVDAQRESKWSWSSKNRNNNNDGVHDRLVDRRKYDSLEDFGDRYEVSEHSTRKPNTQADEFYGNSVGGGGGGGGGGNGVGNVNGGGYGFANNHHNIVGNGYNSNGFGAYPPQGLGGGPIPNNFNNYPLYGNQFNGAYNPAFGYQPNNFRPGQGFNNNFYPNGGGFGPSFSPNYGNGQYYPGGNGVGGGYGPNRFPGGYNPLGNSAANGILVGPSGPTGIYGRPPNYAGPGQFAGNGIGGVGPYSGIGAGGFNNNGFNNNGFYNNYGTPYSGYPQNNGIIPFNSKAGSGILAEADDPKGRDLDKKSNK